jgi:hypothetical protein
MDAQQRVTPHSRAWDALCLPQISGDVAKVQLRGAANQLRQIQMIKGED